MKNMQFLLQFLGGVILTTGSTIPVAACRTSDNKVDISSGINVTNLSLSANEIKTYGDLNSDPDLTNAIANAIDSAKGISVVAGTDFTISNNKTSTAHQNIGEIVTFTITAISNQVTGSFSFILTLSMPDISNSITIPDLNTGVNTLATYSDLNHNSDILAAITSAINAAFGLSVVAGTDFVLTNNQDANTNQTAGTLVTFTVTATGNQITGNFTFTDTIGESDISTGVIVADLNTAADPSATYLALNTNTTITNAVIAAINKAKGTNITNKDFILTNNQIGSQVVGVPVIFTVTSIGSQIQGSFTFTDTLSKTNISNGVLVIDPETPSDGTKTYAALNTNSDIINAVIAAISSAFGTTVTPNDFTLTNNQIGYQRPRTNIKFTVTGTGKFITGSFSFIDTLSKTSINSGVTMPDLRTSADPGATFGVLNNNATILNAVVTAINNAKGTTITPGDIILTNNQIITGSQAVGQPVIFTVTAVRGQTTGSFTFTDTLSKPNISSGITVPTVQNVYLANSTYGALNSNGTILAAITNAINISKNVNVTAGTDYTVTNDQTSSATQVAGTTVTFTVAATAASAQISGSFTFTMTLAKNNISNGITITDPTTGITNGTFGSLNSNPNILNAVVSAINAAKGTTITTNDFTLTNNQTTGAQMASGPIIFTVVANTTSPQITGSFTFTDTITKANISGMSVPTYTTRVNTSRTYGDMDTDIQFLAFLVNQINQQRNITVSTTPGIDLMISASVAPESQYQVGNNTVTYLVTAVASSNLIVGSFGVSVYFTTS